MPSCRICKRDLVNKAAMQAHLHEKHDYPLTLRCDYCNYENEGRAEVARHYRRNHARAGNEYKYLTFEAASDEFVRKEKCKQERKRERESGKERADYKKARKERRDVTPPRRERPLKTPTREETKVTPHKEMKTPTREETRVTPRKEEVKTNAKKTLAEEERHAVSSAKTERLEHIESLSDSSSASSSSDSGSDSEEESPASVAAVATETASFEISVKVKVPSGEEHRLVRVEVYTEKMGTFQGKRVVEETRISKFYHHSSQYL